MRVHWTHLKTEKTQLESRFLLNDETQSKMIARLRSTALSMKTVLKRGSTQVLAPDDPRFLVKFAVAKKTYDDSKIPELDAQLYVLFHVIKQHEKKIEATLLELIANFVKGTDDMWYLINVEHLLFSKHTQLKLSATKLKPKTAVPSRYRARLVKSRTVDNTKLSASASRSPSRKLTVGPTLSESYHKKKTCSSPSSSASNKGEQSCNRTKLQEMPPLFSFPTPRFRPMTSETFLTVPKGMGFSEYTSSSALPLMSYNYHERLAKIRDHIENQNNSLFARIHYCDEHPSIKHHREVIDNSISRVASMNDKVRARAKRLADCFTPV
eukprot:CAMPEP_0204916018 /NCGR_PEP_ID=MMETSP1397-20131031/13926_1 /ASSEMBLY_ACC=CAM_ASM_000891 /TAXON_ID=49980 /ORGANISM="Climacostomum Climacostomum virens, Strain Stock W-24" /LENGTH=324 /DNA_ID=CAMNT_0052088335 /DNA_START=362 /DNA_END=1336 /DNA_ORIENTATION=+